MFHLTRKPIGHFDYGPRHLFLFNLIRCSIWLEVIIHFDQGGQFFCPTWLDVQLTNSWIGHFS
jgi:hypothetical protein